MAEKIDLDFLKLGPLRIPSAIPQRPDRAPQANIPDTRAERERLHTAVKAYVAENKAVLTPPVPFEDLKVHADELLAFAGADPVYREFLAVLLNNETWRDILATIPFNRRLLLLPVCLRVENDCPAPFDEFGLLCKECGQCSIHYLKEEADRLGYATLVAEGTPIVLRLIETGQIDAVVGVSCISVLERVFPYMEQAAAPGIAIPLLQDDCADTNIDIEWLWDVIHLTSDDRTYRMNLDDLRDDVAAWFTPEALAETAGPDIMKDPTGAIAYEWMARDGKRWRPFLTACAWHAYQDDLDAPKPDDLRKLAVAVEAFHKASLIHDDIEDDDNIRYDEPTVHATHGVPVALNVGDFLLGEGYRLIAEAAGIDPERRARMLHIAALGHRTLSMGQGAELIWSRDPKPMTSRKVLDIFRKKTAPAFEVALLLGALHGGADDPTLEIIQKYSEALGIAYQIRDDLDDFQGEIDSNDTRDVRPSLLLALAHEKSKGDDKTLMRALWSHDIDAAENELAVQSILLKLAIPAKAEALLDGYKDEAVRSLRTLENPSLKGLLRRVLGRIFKDDGPETFCREYATRNVTSGAPVAEPVG